MKNKCRRTVAVKGKCPAGTFPRSATFPRAFPLAARFLMKYFHLWKSDRDLDREGVLFRFVAVYGLKDALKIQDVRTARLRNGSTLNNTDFSSYVCYVTRANTFRFLIYVLFVQIARVLAFGNFPMHFCRYGVLNVINRFCWCFCRFVWMRYRYKSDFDHAIWIIYVFFINIWMHRYFKLTRYIVYLIYLKMKILSLQGGPKKHFKLYIPSSKIW